MTDVPTTASPVRGEIRALTGLRIVAAVWVVSFHFMFVPGETYRSFWDPLRPILNTGALGVDLFFVLSGFVITLSYLDKMGSRPGMRAMVGFWWARVCRIWPVYFLVTTVFGAWLLFKATRVADGNVAYQAVQPVVDLRHYVEQLLMVQLWDRPAFDGSSWVGPGWSISAEWLAYCCFPVVVLVLWRLRKLPPAVLATMAVLVLVPIAHTCWATGAPYYPWSWLTRIGGGFLAGAFTCLAVRRITVTPRVEKLASRVALAALAEILVVLVWGFQRGAGQNSYGGVCVLLFPVLVGSLALARGGLTRPLSTDVMVHGGRISFSLYLVHIPLFEVFHTLMDWYPSLAAGSPLATALKPQLLLGAFVAAHLCFRYVEEPARLWLRDRGPGRWARRRPAVDRASLATQPVAAQVPLTSVAPRPVPTPREPAVVGWYEASAAESTTSAA